MKYRLNLVKEGPMKLEAFHEHPFDKRKFPINSHLHHGSFDFPLHYHQEVEMIYVEHGSVNISVLQKNYIVTEGQLVIVGCNHIHSYNNPEDNNENSFHILMFDWKFFKSFTSDMEIERLLYPVFFDVTIIDTTTNVGLKNIGKLMHKLSVENLNGDLGREFVLLGQLHELVGTLIRYGNFNEHFDYSMKQMEKEHELLSRVNEHVFDNYKSGITLTSAAKELGYSEFHFARQFKRYTGITFKQYLTHYQISMAKEDVLNQENSITDIAYTHGFNSVKTFNRVFKAYYGMAPTVYRKEFHSLHEPT